MGQLDGQVALVTGAGSGIGRASAKRLAADGASVAVTDVAFARAEAVAEEVKAAGGQAIPLELDVSDGEAWSKAVEQTVSVLGGLNILHNNAAWLDSAASDGSLADMDFDVWDRIMAVNLRGPALGCKHALGVMLSAGSGTIVNTASTTGFLGNSTLAAYGASKAAVINLTKSVAVTYGGSGIRCNAVAPGFVETPPFLEFAQGDVAKYLAACMPLRRTGQPEEIAAVVAFLASDQASYITGQVLTADGGQLCYLPHLSPFE